jgi:hypothetical protein
MISLYSKDSDGSAASGGAWQGFEFDETAFVWVRTADLRHALSTLFTTSFYSSDLESMQKDKGEKEGEGGLERMNSVVLNTDNRWVQKTKRGTSTSFSTPFSTSLDSRQAAAARWGGFSLSEVLKVARATLDNNNSNNINSSSSSSSSSMGGINNNNNSSSNNSSNINSIINTNSDIATWSALVTSSLLEEKIALSFSSGTPRDVTEWVGLWSTSCCQVRAGKAF